MAALETIKKLISYAECKRRLEDPDLIQQKVHALHPSYELRRLKRELIAEGIEPQMLELSGDEIAHLIYERISRY